MRKNKRNSDSFRLLCEPIMVGRLKLKNRMVLAPAHVGMTTPDGGISSELIGYFEARAQGGVAMIIMGVGLVKGNGQISTSYPRMDQDRYIPTLYRLTEKIHFHNCIACAQLFHPGRFSKEEPISPSEVPGLNLEKRLFTPRAMKREEIEEMIEAFVNAALRAKRANFDMVEIHGATGYLVLQFYSPHTNKRKDEYGGNFENRIRFPMKIIKGIKEKCGEDFPVGFRLVGDEFLSDGFTQEEAKRFAKRLEEGGVAYISVTAGTIETRYHGEGMWSMRSPAAPSVPIAAAIKEVVNIPVLTNGQINGPRMMEDILRDGKADLIALARPLFSDPELPNKTIRGEPDEIRLCTHCCQCFWHLVRGWPITCFQNAEMGKETEYRISGEVVKKKRVLVIGGGPGGLEAARVAVLRGHDVTLWEQKKEVGGQLLLASKLPGKEPFDKYTVQWLARQCTKAGVKIHLNKAATVDSVRAFDPEAVIVASGAFPRVPDIPGVNSKNVWNFEEIITEEVSLRNKSVVIIGGGLIGTEIAELLAIKGNKVVLIEMLPDVAMDMDPFNRSYLLNRINSMDISILRNTKAVKIEDSKVTCLSNEDRTSVVECSDTVLATGTEPNHSLAKQLERLFKQCYSIGDCAKPRKALNAIHEGAYFGSRI